MIEQRAKSSRQPWLAVTCAVRNFDFSLFLKAVLSASVGLLLTLTVLVQADLSVSARPLLLSPDVLELRQGAGSQSKDALTIRQTSPDLTALVLARLPEVQAERFGTIRWSLEGLSFMQDLKLVWISSLHPRQLQALALTDIQKRDGAVELGTNMAWAGQIGLLGLAIRGEISTPLRLTQMSLLPTPLTIRGSLKGLLEPWAQSTPWSMRSINFRERYSSHWYTTPLIQVALWWLISSGLLVMLSAKSGHPKLLFGSMLLLLLSWFALDARWQWQLFERLRETYRDQAALPSGVRVPLNEADAGITRLVSDIRQRLSSEQARIILITADPGGFIPLRTRYHLLPLNVHPGMARLPETDQVKAGDYLLLIQAPSGMRYEVATQTLTDDERRLPVERLSAWSGLGALYRVRSN